MSNQKLLAQEPIGKLLIKYSVPAIISMLVNALYNIVDRMFIGNIPGVGPLAITGVGITLPIMSILLAFGMLVGIGATANMSIKLGQGKKDDAEKLIGNTFTLSIIIGIVLTVVCLLFVDQILALFGASSDTLVFAKQYIIVIILGSIFSLISFALNSTIRADGNPKVAALTMIIGCLINVVCDAVFIFVFGWGIVGAALATVIAQAVSTLMILYYYTKGSSNLKLRKENLKLDKGIVKCIVAIGVAPFAMQIATSIVQVVANNSLKTYGGDLAIGAMAVIASINMLFMMPTFGINQGSQPIIGFNFGAKRYDRVKKTLIYAMLGASCILVVGFVLIQLFPNVAIRFFNSDRELASISARGLRIYLMMMPIVGVQVVGSNYFQATGKAKLATFLSLLRQVILLIPLTLLLPKLGMGLDGVWAAGAVADGISTVITVVFLVKEFRYLNKLNEKVKVQEDIVA